MGLDELRKRIEGEQILPHKDQISINKTGKLVAEPIKPADDEEDLDIDFSKLGQSLENTQDETFEHLPRYTVLKMLKEGHLDTDFIFKVTAGEGENYVQAMRQVLSRARKKAKKKGTRLDNFKLFTRSIKTVEADDTSPSHDLVTLIRSKNMTELEISVYDEITEAFEKK